MSDQLEAEVQDTVIADVETTETETVEAQTDQASETVSDSGENHEKTTLFSPEQKATAGYAFEARKAKRENEELKRQLAEAQQPESTDRPAVPELSEFPEPEELAKWQSATTDALAWDNTQKSQQEASYQAQVTAQNDQAAALTKLQTEFSTNATTAGIKQEDLEMAMTIVQAQGIDPYVAQSMMRDKDGSSVLLYLTNDPSSTIALNGAINDPLAFAEVYNAIRAKAAKLKPKQTDAPQPAEILNGAGSPEKIHPALEGVKYS